MSARPRLRLVHHLHRTGGTLIAKCIASLRGISLLSEVNPHAPADWFVLDPAFQAHFWLRLIDDEQAQAMEGLGFSEKIRIIAERARARGDRLVLRDWSFADFFMGREPAPGEARLSLQAALEPDFELLPLVTVRHPLDQWMSWLSYRGAMRAEDCGLPGFLGGMRRFCEATIELPRIRYEDFAARPRAVMRTLCGHLELPYDEVFMRRWPHYRQVTGDDNDRASGGWKIAPRERRAPPAGLLAEVESNPDYAFLLNQWGYAP